MTCYTAGEVISMEGWMSRSPTWPPLLPWEEGVLHYYLVEVSFQAPHLGQEGRGPFCCSHIASARGTWKALYLQVTVQVWLPTQSSQIHLDGTWRSSPWQAKTEIQTSHSAFPDLVICGLLSVSLHKWTGIGLMELSTKWQISAQIPISWDHFIYCSKVILGCHSNVLWCF